VFLAEALKRGLTSAIVHASKILPRNRISDERWEAAEWLIFDRRGDDRPAGMDESFDPLIHFIDLFPDANETDTAPQEAIDRTLEEQLQWHIIDGDDAGLTTTLDEALQSYTALQIVNDHLLGGMKTVGELFGSGQMQLPFVLRSAEVMKAAVAYLEPHMDKIGTGTTSRGAIVLATVAGDVHDIGKNLVDIILSNNGYEVINLGIKQHIQQIIDACLRNNADAIGMSGLLVKSVGVMSDNLRTLNEQGINTTVLVGGAALTRHHAETDLRDRYDGALYYGRDAFEALRICDHLKEGELDALDAEIDVRRAKREVAEQKLAQLNVAEQRHDAETAVIEGEPVDLSTEIPSAPFFGSRVITDVPLDEIYPYINTTALFRGQWQFRQKSKSDEVYKALIDEVVQPVFKRLQAECRDQKILRPAVVYGYWPCAGDGDDLVIYSPDNHDEEIERFTFPRQPKRQRRCISDFFRPTTDSRRDVIGMSCVTMGSIVSERAKELFESNQYTEYLYLHGFGVECAEALAELWHKRMRAEMGIGAHDAPQIRKLFTQQYRGSRYSFGYPACPDMADQEKLFRLLDPSRIGCALTENHQIDPEQSTSAIIVHHPQAKYFNV
jgi:5-methyltetrahydrofolate--homocysteine methyltransferase